jgi:serine protease Do
MSGGLDIERLGVFQIFTGTGTGSGFLLAPTLLLTNSHVVSPYRAVAVELRDKRRVLGTVRRIHPKRDLAVVELAHAFDGEVLPLSDVDTLQSNQSLQIIGFPVGLPLSITEGVVSNPDQLLGGQRFVQTDAAINPGNSGGPMIDDEGRVVAITTCKLTSADNVGFGIPVRDAREFVAGHAAQSAAFGVLCPSCDALQETYERYCESCGSDLEELEGYFAPPEPHPVVAFVEGALAKAGVDPVLARYGDMNWSFHHGSAPIKIWSCCTEHLCFSSPLVDLGKQRLGDLFRYLLLPEHAPLSFDLAGSTVRLNLTFHMSDVFASGDEEMARQVGTFLESADRLDNYLCEQYGCGPAPETQITFLKEQAAR